MLGSGRNVLDTLGPVEAVVAAVSVMVTVTARAPLRAGLTCTEEAGLDPHLGGGCSVL